MSRVNLNRVRKDRARTEAKTKAAENRVKFGLTKAQKTNNAAQQSRTARLVDQAKQESES